MNVLMIFIGYNKNNRYFLIPSEELKEFDLDVIHHCFLKDYIEAEWEYYPQYPLSEEMKKIKAYYEGYCVRYETNEPSNFYLYNGNRIFYFNSKEDYQVWKLFELSENEFKKYENPSLPRTFDKIVIIGI